MKHKNVVCILIIGLFFTCGAGAFAGNETMTIVTYYPAPYGVYKTLRLYPHNETLPCQTGEMYYDRTDNQVKVCNQYGNYTSLIPSGAVMFFNLASCPSGWSELTAARGRYLVALNSVGALAGTVGTALSNLENRPVGQHSHSINDPGHRHNRNMWVHMGPGSTPVLEPTPLAALNYGPDVKASISNEFTGISINNAGSVPGTNAPYIQFLVCQKD